MIKNTDFDAPPEPFALFAAWFALAEAHEVNDANAMCLATVGADGMPSARMVLMKSYDTTGFTFFTNRESRKGGQLAGMPKAAVCFHWKSLRRSVRIEGGVTPVDEAESDAYFETRPRGSQIGAWASRQSRHLDSRAELEAAVATVEKKYDGRAVPRPPHWGGYRLSPRLIEFWQDRLFRLHDRIIYQRDADSLTWRQERQFP